MLYLFMGQSCTGKSTVADKLKEIIDVEVFAGKDYLRMAKSEDEAWKLFYEKLANAALNMHSRESVVYIITEKEHLDRVCAIKDLYKVKFTASLDVIKSRFAQRMRGNLPQVIERKLEKQFEEWKDEVGDVIIDTTEDINIEDVMKLIANIS